MNKTTLPAIAIIMLGTGSIYSLERADEWQSHIESRMPLAIEKSKSSRSRSDVRIPIEHLENIRAVLNPSMSKLAVLLGVSRQAIYKWLAQDSFPEKDKLNRIEALSKISDALKAANIQRAGALLNMKISDGESLYDLVKADKPYEVQLAMLIDEAKIMEANYKGARLSASKSKSTNDWLSLASIPASREDYQ